MTRVEEKTLAELAARVARLRKTADEADSMLRSWSRRRKEVCPKGVSVGMSDNSTSRWWVHVTMSAADVDKELMPILRRIRDEARRELGEIAWPAPVAESRTRGAA